MPKLRDASKTNWKSSMKHISYSQFSDEIDTPAKKTTKETFVDSFTKQLTKYRRHVEKTQTLHVEEFETTVQKANIRINELFSALADKKEIIALKNEKIKRLKKKLVNKFQNIVEFEKNSIESEKKSNTIESTFEIRKIKTIELLDPNLFIEKNESRIDDWALKIQSKLKRNVHLFPIEDFKIGYVQNLIDGQILRRLEPRLRDKVKNSYRKVKEIIEDFKRMYGDSNRRFIAVDAFRDFRMKGNNFNDFWAEFQRHSSEFDHSESHFLEEFIHKLSSILQKYLSVNCDETKDLYELADKVKKTTNKWRTADNIEAKSARYKAALIRLNTSEKIITDTKTRNNSRASSIPASGSASSASTRLLTSAIARLIRSPNPNPVKKRNMIEGRCFNCDEVGHIAKECTLPKIMKLNEIVKELSDAENSKKE